MILENLSNKMNSKKDMYTLPWIGKIDEITLHNWQYGSGGEGRVGEKEDGRRGVEKRT